MPEATSFSIVLKNLKWKIYLVMQTSSNDHSAVYTTMLPVILKIWIFGVWTLAKQDHRDTRWQTLQKQFYQ